MWVPLEWARALTSTQRDGNYFVVIIGQACPAEQACNDLFSIFGLRSR